MKGQVALSAGSRHAGAASIGALSLELSACHARWAGHGARNAQLKRRAAILAAARILFAEGGTRAVTVRALVARSGITAPTIYSIVGNRDTVLSQALFEMLEICIGCTPAVAELTGANDALAFADTLWLATRVRPGFSRHQAHLNWQSVEGRALARAFTERTLQALSEWITGICGPEHRSSVRHEHVAMAIEAQIRMALLDWADGKFNLSSLRRSYARAVGISLLTIADRKEGRRIKQWIAGLDLPDEQWPDHFRKGTYRTARLLRLLDPLEPKIVGAGGSDDPVLPS